jgi:hypothetical protein
MIITIIISISVIIIVVIQQIYRNCCKTYYIQYLKK